MMLRILSVGKSLRGCFKIAIRVFLEFEDDFGWSLLGRLKS